MRQTLTVIGLGVALAASAAVIFPRTGAPSFAQAQETNTTACVGAGQWVDGQGRALTQDAVLTRAAASAVVLLGEEHENRAHHAWQAQMIAALHARRPVLIGIEALPRSAQGSLDAYVSGAIDEAAFLAQADWASNWGYDFGAYRPIFAYARTNKLRVVALNIDRAFVRRVAREGFAAAAATGAPIGEPAPPPQAYIKRLETAFAAHGKAPNADALARFVQAQATWDRAMAEALAQAVRDQPGALAIGIMGRGHVEQGHGVAHQLRALGVEKIYSALPVATTPPCLVEPGDADALAGVG